MSPVGRCCRKRLGSIASHLLTLDCLRIGQGPSERPFVLHPCPGQHVHGTHFVLRRLLFCSTKPQPTPSRTCRHTHWAWTRRVGVSAMQVNWLLSLRTTRIFP